MGGLEFLQFVAPVDEDGQFVTDEKGGPLPDVMINTRTGCRDMVWFSEYAYLYDANGDHFYRPENCAQPLLNILLFFVAMGAQRTQKTGWIARLLGKLFKTLPDQKVLDACKADLLRTLKTDEEEGYAVINDPLDMMKQSSMDALRRLPRAAIPSEYGLKNTVRNDFLDTCSIHEKNGYGGRQNVRNIQEESSASKGNRRV